MYMYMNIYQFMYMYIHIDKFMYMYIQWQCINMFIHVCTCMNMYIPCSSWYGSGYVPFFKSCPGGWDSRSFIAAYFAHHASDVANAYCNMQIMQNLDVALSWSFYILAWVQVGISESWLVHIICISIILMHIVFHIFHILHIVQSCNMHNMQNLDATLSFYIWLHHDACVQ